ncbi:MAG: HNH endonuclease signature motif containing protein [Acidobacteriota bacterium]|nr:HNH endonuclease signature motif containing protein [Acidobacteriota bacterium]
MDLRRLTKFFAGPSPHLSREDAMKIFKRDKFKCYYCGLDGLRDFESWLILTIDHVHPHSKGGQRSMDNLVTACQPCNLLKGKRVYKSHQEARDYVLAQREQWRQIYRKQVKATQTHSAA